MVRDFHFTLDQALHDLPLDQAFALAAWHLEANPMVALERTTDGYLAQQRFGGKP